MIPLLASCCAVTKTVSALQHIKDFSFYDSFPAGNIPYFP
jgi:hypothetical protein